MKKFFLLCMGLTVGLTVLAEPYFVRVNGKTDYAATATGEKDYQGRDQYAAYNVSLKANDKLTCYNQGGNAEWNIAVIDPYGAYENFTAGTTALVCGKAGTYNIYIKLQYENDMWYIEESNPGEGETPVTPTPDPAYTTSAPEKCPDVVFQAFYWDSYKDQGYGRTKWVDYNNGNNGTSAEEIGQWFDLVWLPPMTKSTGGTGYLPICYSSLEGDWGTKKNLVKLIETLHKNGARVVADIVINHAVAQSGWCNFATQNFGSYGVFKPTSAWICRTDEMKDVTGISCTPTGADDDGYGSEANYDSGRDWDHNNAEVRKMCKAYLRWLRDEIKIDGFRYDYCKGFHNSHIDDYNRAAEAYFSVMEMWDGNVGVLQSHLNDAGWNTLTFDFATKYTAFHDGIASGNYDKLKGAGLLGAGKGRYAVTFLDSHDSFLRKDDNGYSNEFMGYGNSMNYPDKIMQCYAYMLSMPGVPLVFFPHWVTFKEKIKPMLNARYKTGVHSESSVEDYISNGSYVATITGTNGQIRIIVGPSGYDTTPAGFTLAVKGTGYGVYYKVNSARGDKNTERVDRTLGIENVQNDPVPQHQGTKFMQDGKLYIRVGEAVYDVRGIRIQ
ncbi:MAG: hypothetical protein IJ814_03195 [Paludibacteraceae bacterium]|nr:hypothetical protein [Paludibacteraceae bacterium]